MKKFFGNAIRYLGNKVNKAFDQLTTELSQNRTILVWVYSSALLVLISYCVKSNPSSQATAIYTLGGIVGTCFSSWVVAGSYEKVAKMRLPGQQPSVAPPDGTPSEEEQSGD